MLGVYFYFPCNLFYFRSSIILVLSPSTTELNNFFSLFCTTSSRRLSVVDYGELSNVNKNCRCCVVESRSRGIFFKNSKGIKKNIYELLFKCLVNWLIYQKRSMPGRNMSLAFIDYSIILHGINSYDTKLMKRNDLLCLDRILWIALVLMIDTNWMFLLGSSRYKHNCFVTMIKMSTLISAQL